MTNNYRITTAPVLIPDTPDCDYNNGETPLTIPEIKHLHQTYTDYQIIDYQHQYVWEGPYYLRNVGTPIKSWISTKSHTYTDILGNTRTVPSGTWWLTSKITDPEMIQLIDNNKLRAYSLTTSEKHLADKFMQQVHTTTSNKTDIIKELQTSMSNKRTNIHDIENPVAFTVTLTDFPCVGGAVFSKRCLENSKNNISYKRDDIMTEETKHEHGRYTVEDIKSLFGFFSSFKSKPEKEEKTVQEEGADDVSAVITEKIQENNETLKASFKSIVEEALTEQQQKVSPTTETVKEEKGTDDGEDEEVQETSTEETEENNTKTTDTAETPSGEGKKQHPY